MGAAVSPSHASSATPCSSRSAPAPARGPSHGLQLFISCSSVGPSHGLQLFMNCSSVSPSHGVQVFMNCFSKGSPQGHILLWTSPSSGVGSSLGCGWGSAPPWSALWLQGNLCSGVWTTSSSSFCTDLGGCRVVALMYSHPSIPRCSSFSPS